MKRPLLLLFFLAGFCNSFSQTLSVISDGALISVYSDSVLIDGDFFHKNNDTISNFGNIYLTGNWSNDSATGKVFSNGPNGWLHLTGAAQTIGGSAITHFNNLELTGTGIKQLTGVNTEIEDTLALNDRIFDVGGNEAQILVNGEVTNTGTDLGGYVMSSNDGGLSRVTNSSGAYEFPVGSNTGTPRYRPVDLKPVSGSANTFKVRMANVNPNSDSYNVASKDTTLCEVDSNFYHRIYHGNGTDNADVTIYYNEPSDGSFQTIAHWEGSPQEWTNTLNNTTTSGFPFSTVTKTGWNDFSTNPFALAKTAPAPPVISAIGDTTFCSGGSVTLSVITPGDAFLWSNGLTTQSITVNASGNYSVTVTNANGCSAVSSSSVQVTVNNFTPPTLISSAGTTICDGINDTLDAGSGYTNYLWSTTEITQTIFVNTSGTYTVTVTDANGCSGSDSIAISVSVFPDTMITTSGATTFCKGNFVTLDAGSGYSSYQWSTGATTQTINADSTGIYMVTVTDALGCKNDSSQATISVTVNPKPNVSVSPDDTINLGGSDTLLAVGASNYQWYTDINASPVASGTTFIVSPTEETNYTVIGTNANGCPDTAMVKISVDASCIHALPNIFSPNEDGNNDEFKIYGRGFQLYYLSIYDRWGNRVLEIDDINTGWNGKVNNNGEQLNNGVYVYIIKGKCLKSGEDFEGHGNVTLTR